FYVSLISKLSRSDLAIQTKTFSAKDIGHFAKINSLTPVQVCFKYNYTGYSYNVTNCPSNVPTPHPNTEVDYAPSTVSSNSYFGMYNAMSGDGLWSAGSSFVLDKVYIYSDANKASPQVINVVGTANGRFGGSPALSQKGNILVGYFLRWKSLHFLSKWSLSELHPAHLSNSDAGASKSELEHCDILLIFLLSRVYFYTAASSWALQKTLTYNNITFGYSPRREPRRFRNGCRSFPMSSHCSSLRTFRGAADGGEGDRSTATIPQLSETTFNVKKDNATTEITSTKFNPMDILLKQAIDSGSLDPMVLNGLLDNVHLSNFAMKAKEEAKRDTTDNRGTIPTPLSSLTSQIEAKSTSIDASIN
ncbi:hypothetical protein PROFUN_14376, partial [Planoprotostelium fungivorum]